MTKEARSPNDESIRGSFNLDLRISFVIWHSGFVILNRAARPIPDGLFYGANSSRFDVWFTMPHWMTCCNRFGMAGALTRPRRDGFIHCRWKNSALWPIAAGKWPRPALMMGAATKLPLTS